MLTPKQLWLFNQLGEDPAQEKDVRLNHRLCVEQFGAVKNFTTWLTKRLYRKWELDRRRNTTPYLGD
jgi:hypothetical protein